MYNKRLCLVNDNSSLPNIEGIDIDTIYSLQPKTLRAIRSIHHKLNFFNNLRHVWLGNWRNYVEKYEEIIIYDSVFDYFPIEYIKSKNKNCKIYFCYRNRVLTKIGHSNITIDPDVLKEKFGAIVYSYNHDDCKKYGLRYYSQFHKIPKEYINTTQPIIRDIFFIGLDKGRFPVLEELATLFRNQGLSYKIGIVPDKTSTQKMKEALFRCDHMNYKDIINECLKSKCILDITVDSNSGVTYRVLEALVLNRKLITNNQDIKESEFYDPENMFIIGIDNPAELSVFVNKPYQKKNIDINKYSFSNFCKTIFNADNL